MPTLLGQRLPRHQTRTFRSGYCERGKTDSKCDAIGWPQPAPRHWQFPRSGDRAHQQHCAARRTSSASICCRPSCPATSESMTGAGGKDQSKWRRRRSIFQDIKAPVPALIFSPLAEDKRAHLVVRRIQSNSSRRPEHVRPRGPLLNQDSF
jgi:hypothetical protein